MTDVLIFGRGWMGHQLADRTPQSKLVATDIADETAVASVLDAYRPNRVINCAGKAGRPTVDSCEDDPDATYRSNVVGPIVLASACRQRDIHFTHLGSGCVYEGDNGGQGYAESDPPNFFGSLYSRTKILSEAALRDVGALQLRIRMPISSTPHPRNLLTKLLGYRHIVSVPNSVTILDDFWDVATELMTRRETGVWNVVSDGVELHETLLTLYRETVNPEHRFELVSEHTLSERLRARRSNCVLSTAKLRAAGLAMPSVDERLPQIVRAYGKHVQPTQAR